MSNRLAPLACAVVLVVMAPSLGSGQGDYHVPEAVKRAAGDQAVYVCRLTSAPQLSHGSGCLISSSGLVLTNWHVVVPTMAKNTYRIKVDWMPWLPGGSSGSVTCIAPELDLALIKLDVASGRDGAQLAETAAKGDRIYPVGFTTRDEVPKGFWAGMIPSLGLGRTIDTGEIVESGSYSFRRTANRAPRGTSQADWDELVRRAEALLDKVHTRPRLKTDPADGEWTAWLSNAWTTGGQSGGPSFGEDGRLIALNHGRRWEESGPKESVQIPVDLIRLFLVGVQQDTGYLRIPIVSKFDATGGRGAVGLPYETDGRPFARRRGNGLLQVFRKDGRDSGIALRNGAHEAFWVKGAIWAHYASKGGPDYIGYPLGDEYDSRGGRRQDFERGSLHWDRRTNVVTLLDRTGATIHEWPGGHTPGHPGVGVPGLPSEEAAAKGPVDLVFCIDCTSSMHDDIAQVKRDARDLVGRLRKKCSSLRIGLVTYRDFAVDGPRHLETNLPLTEDIDRIVSAVQGLEVTGGGDPSEDVLDGLMAAIRMDWRDGVGKFIVLMGDASAKDPDHEGKTKETIAEAARAVDPAHVYALALNSGGIEDFREIAALTDGEAFSVEDVTKLSEAIENAVSAAIVHHAGEVGGLVVSSPSTDWQTALLASTFVGIFVLGVMCVAVAIRRRSFSSPLPGPPVAWLQVHEPGVAPRNVPVTGEVARIGRDPRSEVGLSDSRVSARHAEVRIEGGRATVTDLSSTNGTWVNGERVEQRVLRSRDRIKLGDTVVIFFPSNTG